MSGATDTQKVITFKNIAQRAVRIPPADYFGWLQPLLVQATAAGHRKHKLRKITAQDCAYEVSKEDEDPCRTFAEQDVGLTHKLEVVESEVGISSEELTKYGKSLRRADYHMDGLDRFNDREGSFISILNECLQKTKNPNVMISPELSQSTTPPTFRCSPEANGNIVAFVAGNAANKTEAKSYIAKFLLRELFPVVHEQTDRFFREKKEAMEKGFHTKDYLPASKGSSILPTREKFQAALNEKNAPTVSIPSINTILEKRAPDFSSKSKNVEAEKSDKEIAADAQARLEEILKGRGGAVPTSKDPMLDDSELSEVSNDKTYLLNNSVYDYQRNLEQGNSQIPRAEAEDVVPSKWPGIPLNLLVTNLDLVETFKQDFKAKQAAFLKLAELKKPNKLVEAGKLLKSVEAGKYSFESLSDKQQLFRLVLNTPAGVRTIIAFAEPIDSSFGKEAVLDKIICWFK